MNARSITPFLWDYCRRWYGDFGDTESRRCLQLHLALLIWLILGAAVTVRTLVRPNSHTVFPVFAASAEHWWDDQSLYEPYPSLDSFRYPPVFALFVTPLSFLGLSMGGVLWSWLSIVVFVAGLWCYARDVIPSAWTRQRTAIYLMLGGFGALRGLWNSQSNALVVGILLLGVAALARAVSRGDGERRGWWLAAFLLALPVCLKLTPLAPVLLLAVLWPKRLAGRLFVVTVLLLLLPFLTRPPSVVLEQYDEWFAHLRESGSNRWIGFRDAWTIWIVLRHYLGLAPGEVSLAEPIHSTYYRLIQLATAAGVLCWCLWQRSRSERLELGSRWLLHMTLSMGLTWLMLFGPAVEHATYVFLTPPLMWALLERDVWPHGRGLILASFCCIALLGWGALSRLLSPNWPVMLTMLPDGTTLLAFWLIGYAATHSASGREQTVEM